MSRKRKSNGKAYEEYCAYRMGCCGFFDIKHIGKSGDYGADIIAMGNMFMRIVVQCKHYSKPVGVKAVQEVNAARMYYGTHRAAVATNSTFTKQAKALARKCGVELWERF